MFAKMPRLAHQIAEQDRQLSKIEQIAEHARWTQHFLEEIKEGVETSNPLIKYWQETLDPDQEVLVRYEPGRHRYAIYTTDAAGTKINVALFTGAVFLIQTTAPGWLGLDYPPGSRLYSGDANRHVILVRSSNLKV